MVRDGRALLVNMTFLGRDFKVCNAYGFTEKNERYELLEDLQPHMLGRTPLVVAGDFCIQERRASPGSVVMAPKPLALTICLHVTAHLLMLD